MDYLWHVNKLLHKYKLVSFLVPSQLLTHLLPVCEYIVLGNQRKTRLFRLT